MCGRYTLTAKQEEMARKFLLNPARRVALQDFKPRFNIAPSQPVVAILEDGERDVERVACMRRWGLVPFWAKDLNIGYKMFNARSETVSEKPVFRDAVKYRRCILPASGFFEWQRDNGRKPKVPYFFYPVDGEPLAMAGLWEKWKGPGPSGKTVESCCILTTRPNSVMAPIHDRMPVILEEKDFDCWLDRKMTTLEKLKPLFKPCPEDLLGRRPISTLVNSAKNDGPEILAEIDPKTGYFVEKSDFGDLFS